MARFTDLQTELHLMILNILRDHDKATGIRSDRNFRRHVLGLDLEDTAMSVYEREPFVRVVVGIAGPLANSDVLACLLRCVDMAVYSPGTTLHLHNRPQLPDLHLEFNETGIPISLLPHHQVFMVDLQFDLRNICGLAWFISRLHPGCFFTRLLLFNNGRRVGLAELRRRLLPLAALVRNLPQAPMMSLQSQHHENMLATIFTSTTSTQNDRAIWLAIMVNLVEHMYNLSLGEGEAAYYVVHQLIQAAGMRRANRSTSMHTANEIPWLMCQLDLIKLRAWNLHEGQMLMIAFRHLSFAELMAKFAEFDRIATNALSYIGTFGQDLLNACFATGHTLVTFGCLVRDEHPNRPATAESLLRRGCDWLHGATMVRNVNRVTAVRDHARVRDTVEGFVRQRDANFNYTVPAYRDMAIPGVGREKVLAVVKDLWSQLVAPFGGSNQFGRYAIHQRPPTLAIFVENTFIPNWR